MHGLSILCRLSPFHKMSTKTKTVCGITILEKTKQNTNLSGWNLLPLDRCKNCVKINSKGKRNDKNSC